MCLTHDKEDDCQGDKEEAEAGADENVGVILQSLMRWPTHLPSRSPQNWG